MSETGTSGQAGATDDAFDLTTRQRLYVFLVVDVIVFIIVLAIAFL